MNHQRRAAIRHGGLRLAASVVLAALVCPAAFADTACLLTPAQLQAATGRAFAAGEAARHAVGESPLCHYAEKDNAKRVLTVGVSSTNAQAQFDSRLRLLQRGTASISLPGVGDRAYFSGTAAGVLAGDTLISISNLRRAGDPSIAPEKVVDLLRAALSASGR